MSSVTFTNVSHRYPNTVQPAVVAVNFTVLNGEFFVLHGPSGGGKSTILRMLHGLEKPTTGTIHIDQVDVTGLPPNDRDVTMALENYALYPHMTVAENMGFALRLSGHTDEDIAQRVATAADQLGLTEVLNDKPEKLTGLQRQTVALARAIVRNPKVFVMDEPLANLPDESRVSTRDQLKVLQEKLGITTLYATADLHDALAVADRIALVENGTVTGVHTPAELREIIGARESRADTASAAENNPASTDATNATTPVEAGPLG